MKHLPWHSALSRPTVRTRGTRVGLLVDGRSVVSASLDNLPSRRAAGTAAFTVLHVTWMSVLDRCQISLYCRV